MGEGGQKVKTSNSKISHGDVLYSMETTANNTALCIRKLLRVHLKSPYHKKKHFVNYIW